jgi:hypothetical protein
MTRSCIFNAALSGGGAVLSVEAESCSVKQNMKDMKITMVVSLQKARMNLCLIAINRVPPSLKLLDQPGLPKKYRSKLATVGVLSLADRKLSMYVIVLRGIIKTYLCLIQAPLSGTMHIAEQPHLVVAGHNQP